MYFGLVQRKPYFFKLLLILIDLIGGKNTFPKWYYLSNLIQKLENSIHSELYIDFLYVPFPFPFLRIICKNRCNFESIVFS